VRTSIVIGLAWFSTAAFPAALPSFDVKAACAIFNHDDGSEISSLYRDCLENELAARNHLSETIVGTSDSSVKSCTDAISKDGPPSYLALLGCVGQTSKQPPIVAKGEPSAVAPNASSPSDAAGPGKDGVAAQSAPISDPTINSPMQSVVSGGFQFTHDLSIGAVGPDVKELQLFLNAHGAQVASDGPGSPGKEANIFGPSTKAALIKFQEAHASELLPSSGASRATGFFGATTRSYVNKLAAPSKLETP
jgi:Putative peptidoglycan binding domain